MFGAHFEKTQNLTSARTTSPRQDSGTCSGPISQKHQFAAIVRTTSSRQDSGTCSGPISQKQHNCKNQPARHRITGRVRGPNVAMPNELSPTPVWREKNTFIDLNDETLDSQSQVRSDGEAFAFADSQRWGSICIW